MVRSCFSLTPHQTDALRELSLRTGIPSSEWLRRFIDQGMTENVLNRLSPSHSGQLSSVIQKGK